MTDATLTPSGALAHRTALIIGLGGLCCPASLALARSGVGHLILVDDDTVDASNLHRQILFSEADVGRGKVECAKEALEREGALRGRGLRIDAVSSRFLPENARELLQGVDIVLEGSDNFATKFLSADACHLSGVPIVHGGAVRMHGTALSVSRTGRPCYRCLFEDVLSDDDAPNCSEAGVLGPVVGFVGSMMADLALDVLLGDTSRQGTIFNFDGKTQRLRGVEVSARTDCPLCGTGPRIRSLPREQYLSPTFAAGCASTDRSASAAPKSLHP